MPVFKDICRICLHEVDYQDAQEINLAKLKNLIYSRPLLNYSFLQKWQIELFKNHLICSPCIHNFHTMRTIYKQAYKANTAILNERNKHQLSRVNLKRLKRFSQLEGDFIVCRLCLKSTRQIAIYLYDNNKNILPVEYVEKMIKHIKIYTNFDRTINPILCHDCWQNIQISYSFRKRLELVTEKVSYYQVLLNKMFVDREDLNEMLLRWDQLGVFNINTEVPIKVKKEIKVDPPTKLDRVIQLKNNVSVKEESSYYNDHNYFKRHVDHHQKNIGDLKTRTGKYCFEDANIKNISQNIAAEDMWALKTKRGKMQDCLEESICEMPLLKPIGEEAIPKEMPKLSPIIGNIIEDKDNIERRVQGKIHVIQNIQTGKKINLMVINKKQMQDGKSISDKKYKTLEDTEKEERLNKTTNREKSMAAVQGKQEEELKSNKYKGKLRSIRRPERITGHNIKNKEQATKDNVHIENFVNEGIILDTVQSRQKNKPSSSKNPKLLEVLMMETLRPKTTLSTKIDIIKDPLSQDLLNKPSRPKNPELTKLETLRPRTRLSTKTEILDDPLSQDLLVLSREEIIKKKRKKRKLNVSVPKHSSTPKISKNTNRPNISLPVIENSPSKSITSTEYIFETLNLNAELPVKKEIIEEEELQIKRELLSECESDDHFTENIGCSTNETEDFEEECPNLECFIKFEPPDDSFVTDLDEEEPPELEFQGPCNNVPVPIPCFTIQNTFTVDEKRHLISTVDDKRNLLNQLDIKAPFVKLTGHDTKRATQATEDKRNASASTETKRLFSLPCQSKTSTAAITEKQKIPFAKVKEDLLKNEYIHNAQEKKDHLESGQVLVNNKNKFNETQANASCRQQQNNDRFLDVYSTFSKLEISPEKPYFCQMCDFSTSRRNTAVTHRFLHDSNSLKLNYCDMCTYASTRKNAIKKHKAREHKERQSSSYTEDTKRKPKKRWSDEDTNLLKNYFSFNIESGTYPSSGQVREFLQETKMERGVIVIKSKIQHLIKQYISKL